MFSSFLMKSHAISYVGNTMKAKPKWKENGSSKSLSPERKIALAPNRVSFSDTPPLDVLVRMGIGLFVVSWTIGWIIGFWGESAVLCVKVWFYAHLV